MVTEWFLSLLSTLQEWFIGLFPDEDVPTWIANIGTVLADVIERASGLGAWFPFALLGVVAVFMFGLWLTLWTIKGVRWLWGLTPFSGGS